MRVIDIIGLGLLVIGGYYVYVAYTNKEEDSIISDDIMDEEPTTEEKEVVKSIAEDIPKKIRASFKESENTIDKLIDDALGNNEFKPFTFVKPKPSKPKKQLNNVKRKPTLVERKKSLDEMINDAIGSGYIKKSLELGSSRWPCGSPQRPYC